MNRAFLLTESGFTAITVLLVGVVEAVMPAVTRPDIFFAVTVAPEFRRSDEGRTTLRRYRIAVAVNTVIALLLTFALVALPGLEILPVLWVLVGAIVAYLVARKRVLPHAVAPSMEREVVLGGRRGPGLWMILLQAGPFALLAAVAVVLRVHWAEIPARFPIHWGANGVPNGWSQRTITGVFMPLVVGAGTCLLLLAVSFAIGRVRRIRATGAQAAAEGRFRATMRGFLLVISWAIAGVFALAALTPLRGGAKTSPPAFAAAVPIVILVIVVVGIVVLMRAGQGGSRLAPPADGETPPVGDRTLDRYWKLGVFYVNRDDAAWIVEKRFGIGYTLNFGHPWVWLLVAGLAILLLLPVALSA